MTRRAPSSTYRLQFSKDQTFADAVGRCSPYLDALGVGALYASPLLESGAGSNHGYDVVDPTRVSDERGGEAGRARAASPRCASAAWASCSTSCPTTSASTCRRRTRGGGTCCAHGRASRVRRRTSTSTGTPGRSCCPVARTPDEEKALGRARRSPTTATELRYYEHAFPVAPGTGDDGTARRRCTSASTTGSVSWKRGAAELTYRRFFDVSTLAAVRVEDPEVFDGHPPRGAALGGRGRRGRPARRPPGRAVRPRRATCAGCARRSARTAGCWWRRSSASARSCRRPGRSTAPRATRRCARSGACSSTRTAPGCSPSSPPSTPARRQALHAAEHDAPARGGATRSWPPRCAGSPTLRAGPGDGAADPTRHRAGPERRRRRAALRLPGVPVLPAGGPRRAGHGRVGGAHPPPRPRPTLLAAIARRDARPSRAASSPRRVQQTSGMVMAKGVEDTAFYRWNRFVALNEVGGDPARFGVVPGRVPRRAGRPRGVAGRRTMTTLSTHDTKRSEDVRARLAVLAEMPGRVGRAAAPLVGAPPAARPVAGAAGLAEPASAPGRSPRSGWRPTWARRPRRPSSSPATSTPVPEVDEAIAAWPGAGAGRRGDWSPRSRSSSARIARPGLVELAGPEAAADGRARACRTSTRAPSCSSTRWSTRTTGARSTGRLRRELLARIDDGWLPGDRRDDGAAKLLVTASALRLRRYRPGAVHRLPAAAGRGAGRRARGRVLPGPREPGRGRHPAAGGARPPRRVGGHGAAAPGRRRPTGTT